MDEPVDPDGQAQMPTPVILVSICHHILTVLHDPGFFSSKKEKTKFALRAKITACISDLAVDGKGGRVKFSNRFSDQLSRQIRQF